MTIELDTDPETCPWCDEPVTDDDGTDWCARRAETLHTNCHYESGCRCPA